MSTPARSWLRARRPRYVTAISPAITGGNATVRRRSGTGRLTTTVRGDRMERQNGTDTESPPPRVPRKTEHELR